MLVLATTALVAGAAYAQQYYIYPQKGQTQEQQNKDRGECEAWARQQTGFDPTAPAPTTGSTGGGAVGGAARGAATGAVIGAIAGNAGKGAAIGAAGGGMMGGMRRNDQRRQVESQQQAGRDQWNRAYRSCMEGRDYTLN
jgi:hypothetical protein